MTVNVLGTEWTIKTENRANNAGLIENDALCDDSTKEITMADLDAEADAIDAKNDINFVKKKVLRHELTHAFLCESGLCECSDWAQNEEFVDWIAIQGPKLYKAWMEANAI